MKIDFFGYFQVEASYIIIAMAAVMVLCFILTIAALIKASKMKKKYNEFMQGENGKSIEKLIIENLSDIKRLQEESAKNSNEIEDIYDKLQYAVSKVGLVKYDAFHEMGGKLSFALCMLDKHNNGCLVNVMHSNNGCFAYVKEIVNGQSYIELGDEEEDALKKAVAGPNGDVDLSKEINEKL